MKILLVIALLLLAALAFALVRASAYKNIRIQKTVTIRGSREKVFDQVRFLKNFPNWSPFLAQDPAQKYEVTGNDGLPGARFHWNGNGGKDLGFQEIVKVEPYSAVSMRCDIQKPFVAHPTFEYSFTPTPEGVVVTQTFELRSGLIDAFFMMLFGAKAQMEKTNEQGMGLLKKAVENS
jgi:uncharacterized protein YndB with AHSA1/START domain